MAKKILTNLDLNQNEIQNAILQPLATAPTNGKLGQIYYNSSDLKLYQHNGTTWICVGVTYKVEYGTISSNSVPIKLIGSDGTTDTVNIRGAGGATLSVNGDTLTISTADTNTTYTFTGTASKTGYTVTITPSSGSNQTFTVPLSDGTNAGLMSPDQHNKLKNIEAGAQKNTVTGVKGSAESSYRTGNINITPTNIGLGNVDNTSDVNKPISAATQAALDKKLNADGQRAYYLDFVEQPNGWIKITLQDMNGDGEGSDVILTADAAMSDGSYAPVQNKVVKAYIDTSIANAIAASDAMIFKGTLGSGGTTESLPTTYKTGWTYRVITAGTYAGVKCEVGDLIIALVDRSGSSNANSDWTVAQTNIDGAITSISGSSPISVTGSGASRSVTHVNSGAAAGSYGDSAAQIPGFGGTFKVPYVTVNATGHITEISHHNITIPNTRATMSADGLMSWNDKQMVEAIYSLIGKMLLMETLTLPAGQTKVATYGCEFENYRIHYDAYDAVTKESLIIDCNVNNEGEYEFSIAKPHPNDIYVIFTAGQPHFEDE